MARVLIDLAQPLHARADAAIVALAESNDPERPGVMVRGNELVRMTERGELENFTVESLRDELSRVAQFEVRDGENRRPKDPPVEVVKVVLSRDSSAYEGIPKVERVVDVPVLGEDGELVTRPGYHSAGSLYYRPAPDLEDVQPRDAGLTEDVEWAKSLLLDDLLGDFDFADDASRAHALGLMLLPFVREYIGSGSTPFHLVLAPDVGSGKTWLAQAALAPGCGTVAATPGTGSDEEWRKRITTMLLGGAPAVLLDNLTGLLDTGALAAALTTDRWTDRLLGENREVNLPIRNAWVATGNNLRLSPDMTRRAVAVFLEPSDRKAADRQRKDFKHPELLEWASENRRALVEAALTLIEHWRLGPAQVVGGYSYARTGEEVLEGQKTLGSYTRWAQVVGGVLMAADVPGFLGNRDRLEEQADDESREAREFLALLHAHAEEPMQTKDIAALCQYGGPLADVVPDGPADAVGSSPGVFNRKLGEWLGKQRGKMIGGYKLNQTTLSIKGNPRAWYVQQRG